MWSGPFRRFPFVVDGVSPPPPPLPDTVRTGPSGPAHDTEERAAVGGKFSRPRSKRGRRPRAALAHVPRRIATPSARRGHAAATVLGVVGALLVGSVAFGGPTAGAGSTPRSRDSTPNADIAREFASQAPPIQLPPATAPPAPAPPTLAASPPLHSHEVFGFAPWWDLGNEAAFDVRDLTTLAYFSVDVNPDGTVNRSDSGWVGYESQALADLVSRAHAAQDRVVLTVTGFDQHVLDQLTSDPSVPNRLASTLIQLVSAKNLDGVNFDFEGNGPQDRQGLDNLIASVAGQLRGADPHWQLSMSTYASSAGDPNGFFDIGGLAPNVDGFFVMAYDMNSRSSPSPTAPLTGPGNDDAVDVAEYSHVVPRSKIILGVPYYGYDWPTAGPNAGDPATGGPNPVTYSQVATTMASQHLASYWDQSSQTPWTAYQSGSQWHQVYFDDPTSLALKARLANTDGIAGVGVWALGMDGNDPAMLAALLGHAAPAKFAAGPSSGGSASGSSPSTSYSYQGVYNGATESLSPVTSPLPGGGQARSAGHLQSFSTNDPGFTCLSNGPPLPVYELQASPTTYVVQVSTPSYCASGTWQFTAPASSSPSGGSSGGGSSPSTTTPPTTAPSNPPVTLPPVTAPTSGGTTSTTKPGPLGL